MHHGETQAADCSMNHVVLFLFATLTVLCQVESFSNDSRWNVVQFLQQSSKFVRLFPKPSTASRRTLLPGDSLLPNMAPLDDVVMGGVSASTFDNKRNVWKGTVTDANNGGFIGIRSTDAFQWNGSQGCKGLIWEIESDRPRRLKFVLRDSTDFNGVTWTTLANVRKGRNSIRIPFDQQVGARFAKRTDASVIFDTTNIVGVQITYSKFEFDGKLNPSFEPGEVEMKLLSLTVY